MNATPFLVLGTADWNQPIATNQHYMVRELSKSYPVLYTESIGLRRPTLSTDDLRRISRRLRPAGSPPATGRPIPNGALVTSPRIIPAHVPVTYRVNRLLLRKAVAPWLDTNRERALWTYTPVTYGLENEACLAVYHCVDLLGQTRGIDKNLILEAERSLAKKGVHAIGSSRVVVQHLRNIGFDRVEYWPNVADTSAITAERPSTPNRLDRAIFAGRITEEKLDFGLLRETLDSGITVAIAGPIDNDADKSALNRLVSAGAVYLGHLGFRDLAQEYWKSRVGLIPYPVNALTAGVNPLKLHEYLAAGLTVVGTPLPELQRASVPGVLVRANAREFAEAVRKSMDAFDESEAEGRMETARDHSWDARGETARSFLRTMLEPSVVQD